jgi:hypothetical protein
MLVTTRNNDNTQTTYSFDPQHTAEAVGFYTKMYWQMKIQGFTATLADGSNVVVGSN